MSASAIKNKTQITTVVLGGKAKVKTAAVHPSAYGGNGPNKCQKNEKVFLSLYAYPVVVRQVGDVVNYYFKITNLTSETVAGPIDFYISGNPEPIGTIDSLPANGFYDLLITDTIDTVDITKRFVVATVWARLRSSGCQLGNVAETVVSVESIAMDVGSLQFANPMFVINADEDRVRVIVGMDIINLATLPVDSLILDLAVIFGRETALTYFIDGLPSDLFIVEQGKLRLAPGRTIAIGERLNLLVTNTDATINLDGYCDQTCETTAAWRLSGKATNITTIPKVRENSCEAAQRCLDTCDDTPEQCSVRWCALLIHNCNFPPT